MRIAVIGSGISGLSAAYHLSKKYHVDLFEKDDHFGGHSYTYDIKETSTNTKISVDLGFIVFNELTYPNLINFFKKLKVPYEKSDMSFSVSVKNSEIEYGGKGFNSLFAKRLVSCKCSVSVRECLTCSSRSRRQPLCVTLGGQKCGTIWF